MPADSISLPQTKGNFGTSRWAARRLGYINLVTRRKGARPLLAQSGPPKVLRR